MGPKSTPGNGWKPCDRGSRPEITDFLERLPDSFLLHTKHSNRSETYGDGPWISYQLYPIIIVIIVIVTIRILIATIRVLTVRLTALQLVAAPCFKSRPWCSGCSRSRRKPLKVLGWKALYHLYHLYCRMKKPWKKRGLLVRCLGVETLETTNSKHLKARRNPVRPVISWAWNHPCGTWRPPARLHCGGPAEFFQHLTRRQKKIRNEDI